VALSASSREERKTGTEIERVLSESKRANSRQQILIWSWFLSLALACVLLLILIRDQKRTIEARSERAIANARREIVAKTDSELVAARREIERARREAQVRFDSATAATAAIQRLQALLEQSVATRAAASTVDKLETDQRALAQTVSRDLPSIRAEIASATTQLAQLRGAQQASAAVVAGALSRVGTLDGLTQVHDTALRSRAIASVVNLRMDGISLRIDSLQIGLRRKADTSTVRSLRQRVDTLRSHVDTLRSRVETLSRRPAQGGQDSLNASGTKRGQEEL
jgi:hypothetical protein